MVLLVKLLAILIITSVATGQFITDENHPSLVETEYGLSPVSALYIMGDSSVDCGQNNPFYTLLHENLSLVPCNGSDSTLLPYLLAEAMGLLNTSLFFGQNGSVHGIKSGLNYGSAHSTIMRYDTLSHQSLNHQLRQVFETFQLLQLQLSEETARNFIRSSIFYLSFGRDDYIDLFIRNSSGMMLKYSGLEFASLLVDQMAEAIRSLYDADVRKMICMGILPLGCAPRVVLDWHNATALHVKEGCVEEINELVLQYNVMLEEHITELNLEYPDVHIIFCDVYHGIMKILAKPLHYGFEDSENACCGLGLLGAVVGCLSKELACAQPSTHVWWDLYNPSQRVNSFLADAAWSGHLLPAICHPISVHDLVYSSFI